jgi:hypothetical protein
VYYAPPLTPLGPEVSDSAERPGPWRFTVRRMMLAVAVVAVFA